MPISGSPAVSGSAQATQVGGVGATAPGTEQATAASRLDQDTFLKLMVAQLRNQDPLNPMDSAEFLAQSAQFTSLERMNQVAQHTAQALSAHMAFGASGLIGQSVTYADAEGNELSGTVTSVRFETTGPVLNIGGQDVTLSQLVTVGGTQASAAKQAGDSGDAAGADGSGSGTAADDEAVAT